MATEQMICKRVDETSVSLNQHSIVLSLQFEGCKKVVMAITVVNTEGVLGQG